MRVIDISTTLGPDLHTYPGDRAFLRRETRSMTGGDALNLSELVMSSHAGTHVDAPYHFVAGGKAIDELPPDSWSGPAVVFEVPGVHKVDSAALRPLDLRAGEIVLLKTKNSTRWEEETFFEDYTYLEESGARWILDRNAKAVGIDYLSIEGYHVEGYPVHRLLLKGGVGIIEGVDLSQVEAARYWFACYPLKVAGGDGGPARAFLMKDAPSGLLTPP